MKIKKATVFLLLVIIFSCNNNIHLNPPKDALVKQTLDLEADVKDDLQIVFVGDFSGKILVKTVLINNNNKNLKKGVLMQAGDSFVEAVFFKYPKLEEEIFGLNISLWIKEEFQFNRLNFHKILINKNNKSFEVNKQNINDYFNFKNIEYNPETGEMTPTNVQGKWIKSQLISNSKFYSLIKEL